MSDTVLIICVSSATIAFIIAVMRYRFKADSAALCQFFAERGCRFNSAKDTLPRGMPWYWYVDKNKNETAYLVRYADRNGKLRETVCIVAGCGGDVYFLNDKENR